MPETDFHKWQIYAASKLLPWRRIEFMLAELTAQVTAGRGVADVKVSDFMLDFEPVEATSVTTRPADFKPRATRKKRAE